MKPRKDKGGPVRRTFRWCRRSSYVVLLLVGGLLVYINQIGIPEFLKAPLLGQLRERGIDLEFTRMRVRLTRGLVVENVNLSRKAERPGEIFHSEELRLGLWWGALLDFQPPQITSLDLRGGRVTLPLPVGEGEPPFPFAIENVEARLRFVSGELWELDELSATCHGGTFHAHGVLTNASQLRASRPKPANETRREPAWRQHLLRAVRWVDGTRFETPPEVEVNFVGDVRSPMGSSAEFRLRSSSASNSLGLLEGFELGIRVEPDETDAGMVRAELAVDAAKATTPWGGFEGFRVDLGAAWRGSNAVPEFVDWGLKAGNATSRWASARAVDIHGRSLTREMPGGPSAPWRLPPTNAPWARMMPSAPGFDSTVTLSLEGLVVLTRTNPVTVTSLKGVGYGTHSTSDWRGLHLSLQVAGATSAWTATPRLGLELGLTPRTNPPATTREWAFWEPLVHVDGWASVSVDALTLPRMHLDGAEFGVLWTPPLMEFTPFEAEFGHGRLEAEAFLDVSTRHAEATAFSTADPHAVSGWMGPKTREIIAQYGWELDQLPRLSGQVGLTLPGWGIPDHPARVAILNSLTLDAMLAGTNLSFRGLPTSTAHGPMTYTNRYWKVGPLDIRRPEGSARLVYENDELTKDYRFDVLSTIDPMIARPLMVEKVQKEMDRVLLPVPPLVEGSVWGRWQSPELIGAQVHVTLTNATVRGQPIEWADGDVAYTNRVMTFRDVRAKSDGDAWVPGARYDIEGQRLWFSNAVANVPVGNVTRIIGPKTSAMMEPYRFERPPRATVDGVVAVRGGPGTDIRFRVDTDDFRWWRLHATNVVAQLHVVDETIAIEGLRGGFCGGRLGGDLFFDWSSPEGDTDYRLKLAVTNVSLREFLGDVWPKTNRLEGRVTGWGEVSSANTRDPKTIVGQGRISMEDGYLWGLPIFGLFSPIFDTISPGLGQTRFTSGSAGYILRDGKVDTRDFEMRSIAMRLRYRGSVSYEGNLDAIMEAALFRDAPLIGRLLSFALSPVTKLLEYRVEGTLSDPKPEPRYVPKFLMNLLRPISLLKSLLPKGDKEEDGAKTDKTAPAP
jgi:hypothetical protein